MSIATTVTLYVAGVLGAIIVPSHVSFPTSVSEILSAVTLAMPESSVTFTVTLINPFGATSVRLSATELIVGGVASNTVYVVELSVSSFPDASVATTVTVYVPGVLTAVIVPSYVPSTGRSVTPLAVTLVTPASLVASTVTKIAPPG